MNNRNRLLKAFQIAALIGILVHAAGVAAIADDGAAAGWRPLYDQGMMYLNFSILVFLIYRFLREPIRSFLQGQSDEVAKEIHEAESRKATIEAMIAETETKLEESAVRFENIKARLIDEGEQLKQQIIDAAREQGQKMLEMEKKKAVFRIVQAKKEFLADMVDAAAKHAQDRLAGEINEDDHRKMLDTYLTSVNRIAPVN